MKRFVVVYVTLVSILLLLVTGGVFAQNVYDTDDLRTVSFDDLGEDYAEVYVTIEPDDVSVLIYIKADDPSANISLTGIYDENDNAIFELPIDEDENPGGGVFGFPPLTEVGGGELAIFLPGSPQFDLQPGEYIFVFETDGAVLTEGQAIIRSGDVDSPQAIDINFWDVSPASGLDEVAAQEEFAASIREAMDNLLSPHDLEIGVINFFVGSEADMDDFAVTQITEDDDSAVGEVCSAMTNQIGVSRALNVAIIDDFPADETGETTGIAHSAGNAGVISVAGSPYSCVVVTWNSYPTSFDDQAANIIHEGSHFMSIPHTTEQDGLTFDLFTDTPECTLDDFDQDGDEIVDEIECDLDGGAKNYMFWNGSEDFAPFEMSEQQAWMIRRHPLFYSVSS